MSIEVGGGFFGLLLLIAHVWAILNIFQSRASTSGKTVWIVLVLILPLVGFILWFLLGPRASSLKG